MRFMELLTKLVVGMGRFGDHLLKKKVSGVVVAALAFACGAGLVHALRREPLTNHADAYGVSPLPCETIAATLIPAETATASQNEEEWDTPELEDWKNRHGGVQLRLVYDSMPSWTKPADSKVVVLPSGRTLTALGDVLYMFGADGRAAWKLEVPQTVIDFAYVKATGVIYVTAGDNNLMILDAATGRVLRNESRNGRAGFGVAMPYGEDMCLVTDDLSGYRADYRGVEAAFAPMQDRVTAWRGTKMLWRVEVPPDAELQVVGSRIFAVTRTKSRVLVKEIEAPKGKR
ncbi:MAG: hypothetical protein ABR603_12535 [Pyrinomonadaceae bacterium]